MGTESSIEGILPHRPPALLVTGVVKNSDRAVTCSGSIPSNHPSVTNGRAPVTMAVEFAAQASGVLLGIRDSPHGQPESSSREGYLVSLRDVEFRVGSVPANRTLGVLVELQASFGNLAMFHFNVECDGEPVAGGRLGVAIAATES